MENKKTKPPKLAKLLMEAILPSNIKDEICGDLEEEFSCFMLNEKGSKQAKLWYWQQALRSSLRFLFIPQRLISIAIFIVSFSTFSLFYGAILFLSYADNAAVYSNAYWLNGNAHKLFLEPAFWLFIKTSLIENIGLAVIFDIKVVIWSFFGIYLLFKLDDKYRLSLNSYLILSLIIILAPYVSISMYFQFSSLLLKQTGPLIALMWLPIIYMILPVGYGIKNKIIAANDYYRVS